MLQTNTNTINRPRQARDKRKETLTEEPAGCFCRGVPCGGCAMIVRCTWAGGHGVPSWSGQLAWRWFIEHPKMP